MGMAYIEPRMTPKPRYNGTVVCAECHAEFMPRKDWIRVVDMSEGTEAARHRKVGDVPTGHCPVCLEKAY